MINELLVISDAQLDHEWYWVCCAAIKETELLLKKPQLAKDFLCMLKLENLFQTLCFVVFFVFQVLVSAAVEYIPSKIQQTSQSARFARCPVWAVLQLVSQFVSQFVAIVCQFEAKRSRENVEYSISSCATDAIFALLLPVTRRSHSGQQYSLVRSNYRFIFPLFGPSHQLPFLSLCLLFVSRYVTEVWQ